MDYNILMSKADCDRCDETDALLVERFKRALCASTDSQGLINFDWLVMHIWLARTDAMQAAFATANVCCLVGGDGKQLFDATIERMRASFERVLPIALPLMAEFVQLTVILEWRETERAGRVASDPAFLQRAHDSGLPISQSDLTYAMGPNGPAGKVVFLDTAIRIKAALPA